MRGPAGTPRAVSRASLAARALALATVVGPALVGLGGCAMSSESNGQNRDSGTAPDGGTDAGPGDAGGKTGGAGNGGAGGRGVGGHGGAAGGAGSGSPSGTGGSSAGAGGATGAAGASGQGSCYVTVEIVNPQLTSNIIEVGPDVRVQVKGTVYHSKSPPPELTWTITSAAAGLLTTAIVGDPDDNVVSFPVTATGNYQIVAAVEKEPECIPIPLRLTGVRSSPTFNVRVTASGFPVTEEAHPATIAELDVSLDPGNTFRIEPHAPGQPAAVMPAYLRISGAQSGLSIEGSTSRGSLPARLFVDRLYDLLIMPDDPSYAPDLVTAKPSSWIGPFIVDGGTPITGVVLGPDGAPLEGARMLLKRGGRPSTIGISDSNGMLSLRTRPGMMSAVVVPPPGSGLPQATLAATTAESSVNLTAAMSSLSIITLFQPVEQGPLTLTVVDPASAKPVSGARVRISSQKDLTNAAVLKAMAPGGPEIQLSASGSVNAEVVSDSAGRASFGGVPTGSYAVLVIPPAGSGQLAITSFGVELETTGVVPASAATLTMASKVALSGTVSPMVDAEGASITAVDTGTDGGGGVASAVADAQGRFTLAVSPQRSYRIIVQPATQSTSIRTVFAVNSVAVGTDGKPPPLSLKLQRGRPLNGTVKNPEGGPVGQAFIQIFCVSSAPSCVDPTLSLAETTSRGDGTFNLLIPDPDAAP